MSGFRPQAHFRVQGRWTPQWPVLDGGVPNRLEVARECQQPLNRSRQFRAECVRLAQSASRTSQAGPAQGLVVSFLRSRHSPPEDNPPFQSMSWISYPVGRFSGVHEWPVLGVRRGSGSGPNRLRPMATGTKTSALLNFAVPATTHGQCLPRAWRRSVKKSNRVLLEMFWRRGKDSRVAPRRKPRTQPTLTKNVGWDY